jgi:hypothetical protein
MTTTATTNDNGNGNDKKVKGDLNTPSGKARHPFSTKRGITATATAERETALRDSAHSASLRQNDRRGLVILRGVERSGTEAQNLWVLFSALLCFCFCKGKEEDPLTDFQEKGSFPYPALSRKGGGKDYGNGKKVKGVLNTPPFGHPFLVKGELRHGYGNGKEGNGFEGFCAFPQNDRGGLVFCRTECDAGEAR